MTGRAIRGHKCGTRRRVRRVIRLLPGRQVAARIAAVGRLDAETIVAAHVALRAGADLAGRRHLMRIGQWETSRALIELAVGPGGDGVTRGAGGRSGGEIRRHVIGHVAAQGLRATPRGLVAAHAIGGCQTVIIVNVALRAGRGRVRTRQREPGHAVIKAQLVGPSDRVMAA